MLKTRLLEAVCAVAMLSAVPAFAQTNTPPAGTPPDAGNAGAAPASNDGMGVPPADGSHAKHHSARAHKGGAMHAGKGNASQDAAVDQLNDQSYAAAQKGQSFSGGGSDQGMGGQGMGGQGMGGQSSGGPGSGGMTRPGGSGDMNAMPGGSMPDSGAAGQGTKP
jgi:hypothetical protein